MQLLVDMVEILDTSSSNEEQTSYLLVMCQFVRLWRSEEEQIVEKILVGSLGDSEESSKSQLSSISVFGGEECIRNKATETAGAGWSLR